MTIISQRTKKIVNEIDYETDYSDSYNMLIQWKSIKCSSIKCSITGTWKLFAEDQFFKQLKEHGENYHQRGFKKAIRTMAAKRTLSLALIIKSDSYINSMIDCLNLVAKHIRNKSLETIKIYTIQRNIERYEYICQQFDDCC